MSDTAYRFEIKDNAISNLERFDDGRWKAVRTRPFETFALNGDQLVRTLNKKGRLRTETFTEVRDGIYTESDSDDLTGLDLGGADDSSSRKGRVRSGSKRRKNLSSARTTDGITGLDSAGGTTGSTPSGTSPSRGWYEDDDDDDDDDGTSSSRVRFGRNDDDDLSDLDDDDDDGDMDDVYKVIVDGNKKVTAVYEYDDGEWEFERIDRDEEWTFEGESLIKREYERYGIETTTFAPLTAQTGQTNLYIEVSETFQPYTTSTPGMTPSAATPTAPI